MRALVGADLQPSVRQALDGLVSSIEAPGMAHAAPDNPSMPIEETDALGQRWGHVTTPEGEEGWIRSTDVNPLDDLALRTPNESHD